MKTGSLRSTQHGIFFWTLLVVAIVFLLSGLLTVVSLIPADQDITFTFEPRTTQYTVGDIAHVEITQTRNAKHEFLLSFAADTRFVTPILSSDADDFIEAKVILPKKEHHTVAYIGRCEQFDVHDACVSGWQKTNISFDQNDTHISFVVDQFSAYSGFIVIETTDAYHLDSDRNVLQNIAEDIYALDDNWSPPIGDGHYVRVMFEENLTSVNDITVFARIVSGNPRIDIYEVNGNNVIASFDSLTEYEYNKVYLNGLLGEQDTFDLHIVGGVVEFDHIIDPTPITAYYHDCADLEGWSVSGFWGVSGSWCRDYSPSTETMTSPVIDLDGYEHANLTFDYEVASSPDGTTSEFRVYASDNGTDYIEVWSQATTGAGPTESGSAQIVLEDYISLTDSVYVRGACDGVLAGRSTMHCQWKEITVSGIFNGIKFIPPTPANGSQLFDDNFAVSIASGMGGHHYTFLDFNNDVILWMPFDEVDGSGDPLDLSSHGNNGTLENGALINSTGYFGDAAHFDGGTTYVEIPNAGLPPEKFHDGFTISAWINPRTLGKSVNSNIAGGRIVDKSAGTAGNDGFYFALRANSRFQFRLAGTNILTSEGAIDFNDWQHVVVTVDADGNGIMYKNDAVIQSSTINAPTNITTTNNLRIGNRAGDTDRTFDGAIDEVLIFNRALSADEVSSLYNASANQYTHEFTDLDDGDYTFTGYAVNRDGERNETEQRDIRVGIIHPEIEFIAPTPANGTSQTDDSIVVNVSSSDAKHHYTFVDFDNSVLGWWRFDNANATHVFDDSSYGNNGTLENGAFINSTGHFGDAAHFDGSNDYIEVPNAGLPPEKFHDGFTISAWIKPETTGTGTNDNWARGRIVDKSATLGGGSGFFFSMTFYNRIAFRIDAGVTRSSPDNSITLGAWHHVVARVDASGNINMYINGSQVVSNTVSPPSNITTTNDLRIGNRATATDRAFDGEIDEVLIFDRFLTVDEIQSLYNASASQYTNTFSNLDYRDYNFTGYAVNTDGGINETEQRTVIVDPTLLTECGVLDIPNTVYYLQNNVSTTGTCFSIIANNVTFDGQGHTVTYGNQDNILTFTGIYSEMNYTTVRNVSVTMGPSAGEGQFRYGVQFQDSHSGQGIMLNVSNNRRGIYVAGSSSNNVFTDIVARDNAQAAVFFQSGNNNTLENFIFENNVNGILAQAVNGTFINGTLDNNSNRGIWVASGGQQNLFSNLNISDSGQDQIYITGTANNNVFENIRTTNTNPSYHSVRWNTAGIDGTLFRDSMVDSYFFTTSGGRVIFEETDKGRIEFLEAISGSGTNLSGDVFIDENFVSVDSNSNLGLNASANITLYNMPGGFTNPVILRDGLNCPEEICHNYTGLNAGTVIFNVTGWTDYKIGEDARNLQECGTLTMANEVYYLQNDVYSTNTCFIIAAQNITFDGQGYNITYGDSFSGDQLYGIYSDQDYTYIRNVTISKGSLASSRRTAIHFNSVNYGNIDAVQVVDNILGINVQNSGNNVFSNILSSQSSQYGLQLLGQSDDNLITNVTVVNATDQGIRLNAGADNIFENILIQQAGIGNPKGIWLVGVGSSGNQFINVTVTGTGILNYDIRWDTAGIHDTLIKDSNIEKYFFQGSGGRVSFEKTGLGRIDFLEAISGFGANLSSDIFIDDNFVSVDSDSKPDLNASANITLYNMLGGFSNPVILRDGLNCPEEICHNYTDLNAGTVIFNVTGWTNYSIGEFIDNINPTVEITTNVSTVEFGFDSINITWLAEDDVELDTIIFNVTLPNGTLLYEASIATGEIILTPTNLTQLGMYVVNLWANDTSNNTNSTSDTFIVEDTIAPAITFVSPTPANDTMQEENNIFVNITSSDESLHYTFVDFNESLIGWWRFDNDSSVDENDTFVYDWSGNDNHGLVLNSGVTHVPGGKFGGAYDFPGGADSCVLVGGTSDLNLREQLTISLWFNKATTSGFQAIFSKGLVSSTTANEQFFIDTGATTGQVRFSISNGTSRLFYSTAVSSNIWNHAVGIYNGSEISFYVNGNLIGSFDDPTFGLLHDSNREVMVGCRSDGTFNFEGLVDEVLLFNRSLSESEVIALYNATANQYATNFTTLDVGEHTFTGYAIDAGGNKNQTETRIVNITLIDSIPPNVTITTNESILEFGIDSINITWLAEDDVELDTTLFNITFPNGALLYDSSASSGERILGPSNLSGLGTYTITLWANDTSNNINSTQETFDVVDTTPPEITILYPTNITYSNHITQLNFTATDNFGLDSCWYSTDGGITNSTPNGCDANFTGLSSVADSNTWIVYANDSSGNVGSDTVTFTVVTAPPTVTLMSPQNATLTITALQEFTANFTSTSLLANATLYIWNETTLIHTQTDTISGTINESTLSHTLPHDGTFNWNYYACTTANTCAFAESNWTITVDTTPPQYSGLQNNPESPTTYVPAQAYQFNATWIDNIQLDTVIFNLNGTNYTVPEASANVFSFDTSDLHAGTYDYYWWANDTAGNINQTTTFEYIIEQASGSITLLLNNTADNITLTYPGQVNASASSTQPITLLRNGDDITGQNNQWQSLAAGYYNFTAIAQSTQNYSQAQVTYFANITQAEPDLSITGTTPITYGTSTDIEGENCPAQLDCTIYRNGTIVSNPDISTLAAGTYSYIFNTSGNENYTSAEVNFTLIVEKDESQVYLYLNNTRSNLTVEVGTTIDINATIQSGEADIQILQDGSTFNEGPSPLHNSTTLTTLGQFNFTALHPESQNFTASSETWWLTVEDTTPPEVTILYPDNITYGNHITQLNFTATDNYQLDSCWYSTDGGATNSTPNNCDANFTGLTSVEGSNTWIVYANDTSGNVGSDQITFTINTSIDITLTSPDNTTYFDDKVDLNYTVESFATIDSCWYTLNEGGPITLTDCLNTTITELADGSYNITVFANNTAGNQANDSVVFTIDTAINITLTSPLNITYFEDAVWTNFTIDSGPPVDTCQYSLNGAPNETIAGCTNFQLTDLPNGDYHIIVYANNSAGTEDSDEVNFEIYVPNFAIEITHPENETYYLETLNLNYILINHTKLDSCWYSLNGGANTSLADCNNTTLSSLPDGANTIVVYTNDTYNNIQSDSVSFTVDTSISITLQSPLNQTYFTETVDVNLTVTPLPSLENCWYSLNGAPNESIAGCTNFQLTDLPNDNYHLIIYANNTAGNEDSDEVNFEIYVPNFEIVIDAPENITYFSDTLDLNYTISNHTKQDSCWYSLNGGANTSLADCTNSTLSGLAHGHHTLVVYTNDTFSNIASDQVSFTVDLTKLTACGVLDISGATYELQNNVSTTGTCFNIIADNITFDGQGYTVTYGNINSANEYIGILVNSSSGVTVTDVSTRRGASALSSQLRHGIEVSSSDNVTIISIDAINNRRGIRVTGSSHGLFMDINASGNSLYGMSFSAVSNNNVIRDNECGANTNTGIFIEGSASNNVTSNVCNGNTWYGVYISSGNSHRLENNTFAENTKSGIFTISSINNVISGNIVENNDEYGIHVHFSSTNALIHDNIIRNNAWQQLAIDRVDDVKVDNNVLSGTEGLYLLRSNQITAIGNSINTTSIAVDIDAGSSGSDDNTFINTQFEQNKEVRLQRSTTNTAVNNIFLNSSHEVETFVQATDDLELIRQWYVQVDVKNATGTSLETALIEFFDSDNAAYSGIYTDSSGQATHNITEYTRTGTGTTDANLHTLNVTLAGYQPYTNGSINITTNTVLDVTMLYDQAPIIIDWDPSIDPVTIYGYNNQPFYIEYTNPNLDNIVTWYINGTPQAMATPSANTSSTWTWLNNTPGSYNVTVEVTNTAGSDSYSWTLNVLESTQGTLSLVGSASTLTVQQYGNLLYSMTATCDNGICPNVRLYVDPLEESSSNIWIFVLLQIGSVAILVNVYQKKKGQGATEYIILGGIVLVITGIVAGTLSGIGAFSGEANERAMQSKLAAQDVAVLSHVVDLNQIQLRLKNTRTVPYRITNINIAGIDIVSGQLPKVLHPGEETTIFSVSVKGGAMGERYVLPLKIDYTELDTGVLRTTPEGLQLIGRIGSIEAYEKGTLTIDPESQPFYISHIDGSVAGVNYHACGDMNASDNPVDCSAEFTVVATGGLGRYIFFGYATSAGIPAAETEQILMNIVG